jgi:hypothetical protein
VALNLVLFINTVIIFGSPKIEKFVHKMRNFKHIKEISCNMDFV